MWFCHTSYGSTWMTEIRLFFLIVWIRIMLLWKMCLTVCTTVRQLTLKLTLRPYVIFCLYLLLQIVDSQSRPVNEYTCHCFVLCFRHLISNYLWSNLCFLHTCIVFVLWKSTWDIPSNIAMNYYFRLSYRMCMTWLTSMFFLTFVQWKWNI